jgi:ribonuclease R
MQVPGRFSPHPRGFGFVDFDEPVEFAVEGGDPVVADSGFVPPDLAGGWIADDQVVATVALDDRRRVNVVSLALRTRTRKFVVGRVATFAGSTWVIPDARLGSGRLPVSAGLADRLVRVDDRQVVTTTANAEDGTAIAQSLVAGPTPAAAPAAIRARAVTIAHGGVSPDVVTPGPAAVGLPVGETVGNALRTLGHLAGGRPGLAAGLDVEGRIPGRSMAGFDRREEVVVTIDDDRSRDLDDALVAAWDGSPDAPVSVAVHIADAASAVGIDSPADRYATTMATTTYLAVGGPAPMLDPVLSEDALSLLPGVDRSVLSVDFQVAPDGSLSDVAVNLGIITVSARLSYAAVDAFLASIDEDDLLAGAHGPHGASAPVVGDVAGCVAALSEAARRLGVERDARDTLDGLFVPAELEAAVVDGKIRAVPADPHPRAQHVVERLMVATNELVATWALDHDVPLLYRTHLGFDPERVAAVETAAEAAGVALPTPPTPAAVMRSVTALRADGEDRRGDLLATAAAGAVARATTSATPDGHEGLDAAAYTQFTSPIRRFTDLVVHRQVRAALAGEDLPYDHDRLVALAAWLDVRAGAAGHAQALERTALWSVLLERGAVPWPATAIVTGLSANGARVRLPVAGIGGFVAANRFDRDQRALRVTDDGTRTEDATLTLGQRIEVELDRIDPLGRADFRPTKAWVRTRQAALAAAEAAAAARIAAGDTGAASSDRDAAAEGTLPDVVTAAIASAE